METETQTVFTVGHSTHDGSAFIALLKQHEIDHLVDIRTVPRSSRHPHFNKDSITHLLEQEGIAYTHLKSLGGWRKPMQDSPNTGWRNRSFQGYADYMATEVFENGLNEACSIASTHRTAVMCAEASWTRCHRRLVADALISHGWCVFHIEPHGGLTSHQLTPFAKTSQRTITYPPPQMSLEI